jgi:hypothetical protein
LRERSAAAKRLGSGMWKSAFMSFRLVHGLLLALAAVGAFKFWRRTHFWLPTYVHLLGGIGLIVGVWSAWAAPADSPISAYGPIGRLLLALVLPGIIYLYFMVHGGQRAAFSHSSRSALAPCPNCKTPIRAFLHAEDAEIVTATPRFLEPQCPHCDHALSD